jgi:hypothetical protein
MKPSILVMTQNMTMQNPMAGTGREGDGGDDDVGTNTTATMSFRPPGRVQPCPAVAKTTTTTTTGALFIYLFYQHLSYVYTTAGTGREGEGPRFIDGTQQVDHQQYFFFLSVLFLLLTYFRY